MSAVPWLLVFIGGAALGVLAGLWVAQRRREPERLNETALRDMLAALSAEVLGRNADHQRDALEATMKPVQDALERVRKQHESIERDRHTAYGNLAAQLQQAVASQHQLSQETQNLSKALSRPGVRGAYGEITLRKVLELAGMTEHVDFVEQEQQTGGRRPDVVVHLPEDRVLPIDAKAPLQNYLDAYQETDPRRQRELLQDYARAMRGMAADLAKKEYWANFASGKSLDFVVMFVPGEQFLTAALEQEPTLMEDAMNRKVLLATPASLMAILRAIAYGWNQQKVAENSEQVRKLGYELYERLADLSGHMANLRKSLAGDIGHFNKMVGTWERRVLPTTRKFRELGIDSHKRLAEVEEIDQTPRELPDSPDGRRDRDAA